MEYRVSQARQVVSKALAKYDSSTLSSLDDADVRNQKRGGWACWYLLINVPVNEVHTVGLVYFTHELMRVPREVDVKSWNEEGRRR